MLQNVVQFQGYQHLQSVVMCLNLPESRDKEPGETEVEISQTVIQEIKVLRTMIEHRIAMRGVIEDLEVEIIREEPLEEEEEVTEEIVVVVETIEGEGAGEEEVRVCFSVHLASIKDRPVRFQCLHWITYFLIIIRVLNQILLMTINIFFDSFYTIEFKIRNARFFFSFNCIAFIFRFFVYCIFGPKILLILNL